MSTVARGAKNAYRNVVRTVSIVLILSLSFALALVMLLSYNSVKQHINQVSSEINNTITITPAGSFGGFGGGGNPFTEAQIAAVEATAHVTSVTASTRDTLQNTTQAQSSTSPSGGGFGGGGGGQHFGFGGSGATTSLVSPITPGAIAKVTNGGFTLPANFHPPMEFFGTSSPANATVIGATSLRLDAGTFFSPSSKDLVADVAQATATKNKLAVGSTLTAYDKTIKVVGIFTANTTRSNATVLLPLKTQESLQGVSGPTSMVAEVDSIANVSSATAAIQAALGTSVATVTSSEQDATQVSSSFSTMQDIALYSLIGALAAGGVILFLSMLMVVRERRREIGILKAFGASNANVVLGFVTESLTLTVMAGVVGSLLGAWLANPVLKVLQNATTSSSSSTPFRGPFSGGGVGGFHLGTFGHDLRAATGLGVIGYALAGIVLIALIGSSLPAYAIAKVRPAEVLRGE